MINQLRIISKSILAAVLCAASLGYASQGTLFFNTKEAVFHEKIPALTNAIPKEIREETSFFQSSTDYVEKNGGPIAKGILKKMQKILTDEEYQNMRVDVKVQKIAKNSYSNSPGWHCDYFADFDDKGQIHRFDPESEDQMRIFLLSSGEPKTEFIELRDIPIGLNVDSWKDLSNKVDSTITQNDLWRIPSATIVEIKGNELHRVTPYQGEEPTVRFFMRMIVFPKTHPQYGKHKNTIYNWETHIPTNSPNE
jgi:hypothetical protein